MVIPQHIAGLLSVSMLLTLGCNTNKPAPKDEPSYTDLVVVYNAELETLDRLERKRQAMIDQYEAQHRVTANDALQSLTDVITSAGDTKLAAASDAASDPHAALDQAVQSAEKAHDAAARLLQTMTDAAQAERAAAGQQVPYSEEFQQQLAALDQEIEKQKARVERARQARDAAEQNSEK